MIIEDQGVIVGVKEFEEKYLIVQCFLRNHGLMRGLIRITENSKADCMPGNIVQVTWSAKLREQLGYYKFELIKNILAATLFDRTVIAFIKSALTMTMLVLHEKEKQTELFDYLRAFLNICDDDTIGNKSTKFYSRYLALELCILKAGGYGLALNRCGLCGSAEELVYISPRTGSIISRECGKDYDAKLIKTPQAILNFEQGISKVELYECLKVTQFFIEKNILNIVIKKIPLERELMLSFLN